MAAEEADDLYRSHLPLQPGVRPCLYVDASEVKVKARSNLHFRLCDIMSDVPQTTRFKQELARDSKTKSKTKQDQKEDCPLHRHYSPTDFVLLVFEDAPREVVKKILRDGIRVQFKDREVRRYEMLGYSDDQLKNRKCVFYHTKLGKQWDILRRFGDFEKIRTISKRAARIGLILKSSQSVITVTDQQIEVIEDITQGPYCMTDGCGFISPDLALQIIDKLRLNHRYEKQHPAVASVYQVRIQGCKGVLIVNPKLHNTIQLRKSMVKFEWNTTALPGPYPLCLVSGPGISTPYKVASLNLQYVRLLSALGLSDDVLLQRTEKYLQEVQSLDVFPGDTHTQFIYLCAQQKWVEAESLLQHGAADEKVQRTLRKIKSGIISSWRKDSWKDKDSARETNADLRIRIPISESRTAYGVCDPTGTLTYGQCFFQPTEHGKVTVLDNVRVVVSKNPCYHVGDIRVLTCVNIPECHHLVDCIVFPVQGLRPHSNEIAGSDLDGDQYFVCWDEDLIPPRVADPASYSGNCGKKSAPPSGDLVDHFVTYRSHMARVDSLYERWANSAGAGSPECQLLANLFSVAVDSAKTGERIQIPSSVDIHRRDGSKVAGRTIESIRQDPQPTGPRFVWGRMLDRIGLYRAQQVHSLQGADFAQEFDMDFLRGILTDQTLPISQFSLFRLVVKWADSHTGEVDRGQILELLRMIDFSHFMPGQRQKALYDVHTYGQDAMNLVRNSLYRSSVLAPEDIKRLQGDISTLEWVLEGEMCTAPSGPTEPFTWHRLNTVLTRDIDKMLVFQIVNHGNAWVLVLVISEPLKLYDTVPAGTHRRLQTKAYMSVHGEFVDSRCSPAMDETVLIGLDGDRIQIYNSLAARRTDTFICIMEREDGKIGMSVALEKFKDKNLRESHNGATVNRHEIKQVEIFCRHKNPFSTQRVHKYHAQTDARTGAQTDGEDTANQNAEEFHFHGKEFPDLNEVVSTDFKGSGPIGLVPEFEAMTSQVLEQVHAGSVDVRLWETVLEKLEEPELMCETSQLLVYVLCERYHNLPVTPTQCTRIMRGLLQLRNPLPQVDRLVLYMQTHDLRLSLSSLRGFLLCVIYDHPDRRDAVIPVLKAMEQGTWPVECAESCAGHLLRWWSLLTIEQHHAMSEAVGRADSNTVFYKGHLFTSTERESTLVYLSLSGSPPGLPAIQLTDGLALSPAPDPQPAAAARKGAARDPQPAAAAGEGAAEDVLYNPVLFFCIEAIMDNVILVRPVWPSADVNTLTPDVIKARGDKTRLWRVDTVPNMVTYDRMLTAVENSVNLSKKNKLLAYIIHENQDSNVCDTKLKKEAQKPLTSNHNITQGARVELIERRQVYSRTDGVNDICDVSDIGDDVTDTRDDVRDTCVDVTNTRNDVTDTSDDVNAFDHPSTSNTETKDKIQSDLASFEGGAVGGKVDMSLNNIEDEELDKETQNNFASNPNITQEANAEEGEREQVYSRKESDREQTEMSQDLLKSRSSLNASQSGAVAAACGGGAVTLVRGPPGTGKTVTAAHVIAGWLKAHPDGKILACAETNEGINNIVKALLKIGVDETVILRVGACEGRGGGLERVSLERQVAQKMTKYKWDHLKQKTQLISKAKVICSTCIGAGCTELKDFQFRSVLIDEAGQATEPASLVPLCLGAERVCLVGDDKQLPPLVLSRDAKPLSTSIFTRLALTEPIHMLDTQYRMHPDISLFPSETFYGGSLVDGVSGEDRPLPEGCKGLFTKGHVLFIDMQFCGSKHRGDASQYGGPQCGERHRGAGGICNPREVLRVMAVLRGLLENRVSPETIAVISPYRKQVEELTREVSKLSDRVTVKTIDGFQGQERDIIILSTVRANHFPASKIPGQVGHLGDRHRMNVALTRARCGLIVVGHRDTLRCDDTWGEWLQHITEHNTTCQYWCEQVTAGDHQQKSNTAGNQSSKHKNTYSGKNKNTNHANRNQNRPSEVSAKGHSQGQGQNGNQHDRERNVNSSRNSTRGRGNPHNRHHGRGNDQGESGNQSGRDGEPNSKRGGYSGGRGNQSRGQGPARPSARGRGGRGSREEGATS